MHQTLTWSRDLTLTRVTAASWKTERTVKEYHVLPMRVQIVISWEGQKLAWRIATLQYIHIVSGAETAANRFRPLHQGHLQVCRINPAFAETRSP